MNDIDEHIARMNLVYDMLNSPTGIDVRFSDATGDILISGEAIKSGSVVPDAIFQYIYSLLKNYCGYIETSLYVKGLDLVGDSYYFTLPEIVFCSIYSSDRINDRNLVLKRALYENTDISFRWDSSDEPADSAGISQELDSFLNTFKRSGGDKQ